MEKQHVSEVYLVNISSLFSETLSYIEPFEELSFFCNFFVIQSSKFGVLELHCFQFTRSDCYISVRMFS
uniref:Uncharacterized protein n=1 Tax=Anguilla anguilla TaxID=7936 RepID=A0A0E9S8S9_ANGAN